MTGECPMIRHWVSDDMPGESQMVRLVSVRLCLVSVRLPGQTMPGECQTKPGECQTMPGECEIVCLVSDRWYA